MAKITLAHPSGLQNVEVKETEKQVLELLEKKNFATLTVLNRNSDGGVKSSSRQSYNRDMVLIVHGDELAAEETATQEEK